MSAARRDQYGPIYTPEEVEAMNLRLGRRLRGVVKIASEMDESDPDQLADKAWLIGTVEDVTAYVEMIDAAYSRARCGRRTVTALPEELREAVETIRRDLSDLHDIRRGYRTVNDDPPEAEPGTVDPGWTALATLTAHLFRRHELLREAEEAIAEYDEMCECGTCVKARSWLARFHEQEEGRTDGR